MLCDVNSMLSGTKLFSFVNLWRQDKVCSLHALFQHLICLQIETHQAVMAQTLSKQHQTNNNWLQGISAFDQTKHIESNVICLDGNRITKTQ